MSIRYLHLILLFLMTIIILRVFLGVKNMSDLQQNKICIAFNNPSAKTSIRPICKVEVSEFADHCFSQLSYLKNENQLNQSCAKYVSHVTEFKESIRYVNPQDFVTTLAPRPEDQLSRYNLPYYYSSVEDEINRLQKLIQATDIHYVGISDAKNYDALYKRCHTNPSTYTNINQVRNPDPHKASACYEYASSPYLYGVSPRSATDNLIDFTIDIKTDRPITLALDNSDYVNWQLTGNTQNVKVIFVLNNQKATLDKSIDMHHIYALRTFKNVCSQCKGLQFESSDFKRYETPQGSNEEFQVLKARHFPDQPFTEHQKSNAKSITIQ